VFNSELGTLSLLVSKDDRPYQLMEQQFTSTLLYLLMPLLEAYPYYCPHEMLHASFNTGLPLTEEVVERSRQRLHEASLAGLWDQEMKPVRNVLCRVRLRLRSFGLTIHPILETGYLLIRDPRLMTVQKPEHTSSYRQPVAISLVGSERPHEAAAAEGAAPATDRGPARPAFISTRVG
jgi:hypothetical protein